MRASRSIKSLYRPSTFPLGSSIYHERKSKTKVESVLGAPVTFRTEFAFDANRMVGQVDERASEPRPLRARLEKCFP